MKFNWGTGIVIFLALFLAASAAFIIFAINQDVSLVHKDYYEKGVDYSAQMEIISRSEIFKEKVNAQVRPEGLQINIDSLLTSQIDSGKVTLYRPSGKDYDLEFQLTKDNSEFLIPSDKLISGRYILKVNWYANGLRYEVDKQVIMEK